ncbi:hypothetical protein, partial [Escherichia coli]|uniref:hypothetical protein n=1 Tax=Escherichia coli TaxID=562 RepID=UPI002251AF7E
QLKAAVLMSEESGENLLESIGYQALLRGDVHTAEQLAEHRSSPAGPPGRRSRRACEGRQGG